MSPQYTKVKVCHLVSGDLWAGAEAQVATLLCYLFKQAELDVYAVVLNEGRLANELRKLGIHVKVIDETKTSSFLIVKQFLDFFKKNKIDILHTHRYKENILGGVAAKLRGIPFVVRTVHGLPEPFSGFKRIKMSIYSYLDDLISRYIIDKVITVSLDIKSTIQKMYPNGKVVCIHNSIDLSKIKTQSDRTIRKKELQISLSDKIIGTVGRLTPVKCIDDFIRAARIIAGRRSDVTFLIVGDGPLRNSLEEVSKRMHLDKCVRFLGQQEEIHDLINIMDIFVLSSTHEGIPTALLEALAMGKPAVATRVGGIPEVLKQDGLGILIEPKNPAQLAEACLKLLKERSDDHKQERKHYIAQEFSSEIIGPIVRDLYKDLARRRHGTT